MLLNIVVVLILILMPIIYLIYKDDIGYRKRQLGHFVGGIRLEIKLMRFSKLEKIMYTKEELIWKVLEKELK